jgi:DNA replication protein DnaC
MTTETEATADPATSSDDMEAPSTRTIGKEAWQAAEERDSEAAAQVLASSPHDPQPTRPCDRCDFRGIEKVVQVSPRRTQQVYCDCRHGRRKHLEHYRRLHDVFDHAGVPDRLRGATLQSLEKAGPDVMQSEAVRAVRRLKSGADREGLCLFGPNGIGKTGLLVIIARHYYTEGYTPLFIKYGDLIRDGIQAGYGQYTREDVELSGLRLRTAQRADVLCLDDLGDPFGGSDYEETKDRRDLLFQIVAARHERSLPTHITANYGDLTDLMQQFDPRIADRLREMCTVTHFHAESLRK